MPTQAFSEEMNWHDEDIDQQWDDGCPLVFPSLPVPGMKVDFGSVRGEVKRVTHRGALVVFHASFPQWHPWTVQCEHSAESR